MKREEIIKAKILQEIRQIELMSKLDNKDYWSLENEK